MTEPDLLTRLWQLKADLISKYHHDAGLARASDPATSHAAAESVDATTMEAIVHRAICKFGPSGCIADDVLLALPEYTYGTVTPRFRPLIAKGLIVLTGEKRKGRSGRSQRVMVGVNGTAKS